MGWLSSRLRFWMLGPLVAVIVAVELAAGLPGWSWVVVYGVGLVLFGMIMRGVIDREGPVIGSRDDFRHGHDMHGHY